MNVLWMGMISASIVYGLISGNAQMINESILQVGKETFDFVLPLICVTSFWNGVLSIAEACGLLRKLERLLAPFLRRLLPDLKEDEKTLSYVAANVSANFFGLGSAATPFGLKAMEGMQKHNQSAHTATRSMVTFLVLNTAGVTVFSTTILALRVSFHSQMAADFMPYAVIATVFASFVGLLVDRVWNYHD